METIAIEKIQTGLTANYVPYWTVEQGLKEAMQNIAYGSIKSEEPANLFFDNEEEMWAVSDSYIGFEKRHLYIGESEQREDEEGMGVFGEGWKIFLLVMARNNIKHKVSTVGFDFYGTMEPTPHGTDVLVINVEPNLKVRGTTVFADVEKEQWETAMKSFAILQGIPKEDLQKNTILPNRRGELWVQGVRIEQKDDTNPLKLHYSYNLKQRDLINRDRSHVNTELAYAQIKTIVFQLEEHLIREYVSLALEGNQGEDILRGPNVPVYGDGEQKKLWLDIIAELHATKPENLVIPSYNQAVNGEAKRRGLVPLDTPRKWDFELTYLGIPKADDVIDDRYNIVEESAYGITKEDKSALAKARTKMKNALGLGSVTELPAFQYVSEIKNEVNGEIKKVHYEKETNVVYLLTEILNDERTIVEYLLPELIRWKYEAETFFDMEKAYKDIVLRLLFK